LWNFLKTINSNANEKMNVTQRKTFKKKIPYEKHVRHLEFNSKGFLISNKNCVVHKLNKKTKKLKIFLNFHYV